MLFFRQALRDKLTLFTMALAFSLIAFWAQQKGGGVGSYAAYPVGDRIFNAAMAYIGYLLKTFWPENLSVFYPFDNDIPFIQGSLATLLVVALSAAAWRWGGYAKPLLVGWFWFIVTLIPTIGIIKIGDFSMADRYLYIPQIGLFIVFSWGAYQIATRWLNPIMVAVACCLIIGLLTLASYHQVKHWQSSGTLFAHALEVNPHNYFAHYAMGRLLASQREYDRALDHFSRAVNLAPDKYTMRIDFGRALIVKSRFREALEVLETLIPLNHPSHQRGELYFLKGLALMGMGRSGEAESNFIHALNTDSEEYANNVASKSDSGGTIDRGEIRVGVKRETSHLVYLAKIGYANWRLDQEKMYKKQKNASE
ncbi:hypothetical protein DSCOOX_00820 [Desulfosarcina ovata subsp. ovata]|uniref:Uncharacterized protein n=1 Tax=Desulfosarcina ovata subsp. ovata TaxID=2752305 RepID=A0A5K8A314_9BACT|nr:hypothetical protein DSCOOX_00820 [Desulfosarcina ovata subsp. ovata]